MSCAWQKNQWGGGFSAPWLIVFTPVMPESHTARLKRYRPLRRRPIGFSAEHTTAERKRGRRPAHRAPFRHPKPHKNSHNIRDRKISRSKFAHSKYDAVGRRWRGRYRTVARQSQDGHGAAARWSREGYGMVTGPLWDGYGTVTARRCTRTCGPAARGRRKSGEDLANREIDCTFASEGWQSGRLRRS